MGGLNENRNEIRMIVIFMTSLITILQMRNSTREKDPGLDEKKASDQSFTGQQMMFENDV